MCGCAVSRRYVDACYCDMFSVVNVYLDHLKFCAMCVYGCCCCMPFSTILVVNPGSPGLESSVLVSS